MDDTMTSIFNSSHPVGVVPAVHLVRVNSDANFLAFIAQEPLSEVRLGVSEVTFDEGQKCCL